MKLQDYLNMNSKFTRMEKSIDVWAVDYSMEKLVPLVEDGFEYDDIANFILTRWDNFVQSGKLDEVLERNKEENEKQNK
jgi:hypothetical protein